MNGPGPRCDALYVQQVRLMIAALRAHAQVSNITIMLPPTCTPAMTVPFAPLTYPSRSASSFLFTLSSNALIFLTPHFALPSSTFFFSCSLKSSEASQHIRTKNVEQLNFLASFGAVHVKGSVVRNVYISSISASVRWYLTPIALNFSITGGSRVGFVCASIDANNCFRLSSLGMNIEGV